MKSSPGMNVRKGILKAIDAMWEEHQETDSSCRGWNKSLTYELTEVYREVNVELKPAAIEDE